MSKPTISIRKLRKRYHLGSEPTILDLREAVTSFLKHRARKKKNSFWALRGINCDFYEGEAVGIIGKNGAGKSTLLKILSRITPPTRGEIRLWGNVSSLLEIGTGFSADLTGRENIFLNGAILGMPRRVIHKKMDEIVAFAGVDQFLDTPVKRYSSGMYVRLAFAVAAHLEPDILIIDEVLAVGDLEFQKKCLGKMESVAKSGRTVLFVSHNMGVIRKLCNRAILLNKGRLILDGPVDQVIDRYVRTSKRQLVRNLADQIHVGDISKVQFNQLNLVNSDHESITNIPLREPLIFKLGFKRLNLTEDFRIELSINANDGAKVFQILESIPIQSLSRQSPLVQCLLHCQNPLVGGTYSVDIWVTATGNYWRCGIPNALTFTVDNDINQNPGQGYVQVSSSMEYK